MSTYADLNQLLADYLPEVKLEAEKATVGRILIAVSRQIDNHFKRPPDYFAPAAAQPAPRYFVGEGTNYLRLPVHVEGSIDLETGVEVAGHPVTNWVERGGWLYMTQGLGRLGGKWVRGVEYTVRARWGFAETPPEITEACRQLVTHNYERQRGTLGQVSPSGFVIEREMPPTVKAILASAPYRKKEFEVV